LHGAGGAVATWAPTGVSYNEPAAAVTVDFLTAFFGRQPGSRIGDISVAAASQALKGGTLPYIVALYNVLGDPATVVR
jgi:hypothetical protein